MRLIGLAVVLAVSLALAPLAGEAQQAGKIYRVGFLSSLPVPATAISDSLRNAGFIEGQNVVIDRRLTEAPEQLPTLAEDLVRHQPDVVVAFWNRDVVAAQAATRTIPIVMVVGVDPVGAGLVASLARPGGNVTGSLLTEPAIAGKTLQTLKEAVPTVDRVAVLWNPSFTLPAYYKAMREAARASGMTLLSVESRTAADFDGALTRVTALRPHALFVDGLAIPRQTHHVQLVEFAARQRLPAVYTAKRWVISGGLMSYNASVDEAWTRTGKYIARILKGAKPADLPVLKTAKALGITVPHSLLLRADQIIDP